MQASLLILTEVLILKCARIYYNYYQIIEVIANLSQHAVMVCPENTRIPCWAYTVSGIYLFIGMMKLTCHKGH